MEICKEIAALGHTQYLVIADPGLPIPQNVPVIDLALVNGIPAFCDVLDAVAGELVIDSFIFASEMKDKNKENMQYMLDRLQGIPCQDVSHEEFKKMTETAKCIIRTGECTSYANVILEGGVSF